LEDLRHGHRRGVELIMKRAVFIPDWEQTTGFGGKPNPSEPEQSNQPEKTEGSKEEVKEDEPDGM